MRLTKPPFSKTTQNLNNIKRITPFHSRLFTLACILAAEIAFHYIDEFIGIPVVYSMAPALHRTKPPFNTPEERPAVRRFLSTNI